MPQQLVADALRSGVKLFVEGGKLKFTAQKGKLTAQLKSRIGSNKEAIIAYLTELDGQVSGDRDTLAILQADRAGSLPASHSQKRLWLVSQVESKTDKYHLPFAFHLKGELNFAALQYSLSQIVLRHEVLRTTIVHDNGQVYQQINEFTQLPIEQHDLSELSEVNQKHQLDDLIAQEEDKPFVLEQDLPIRVVLIRVAEQEYILQVTMHHIASDGWSIGIFLSELVQMYRPFCQGVQTQLPPLTRQYADYAKWQVDWLDQVKVKQQVARLCEPLKGAPATHSLPTDFQRPPQRSFNGRSEVLRLAGKTSCAIGQFAAKHKVTKFILLQTLFALFVGRYSSEQQVVMGTSVAGRDFKELEGLIGFFVNSVVLPTRLNDDESFVELLQRNKQSVTQAFNHQNIPFDLLIEQLNVERNIAYSPIFQILFVMHQFEEKVIEVPSMTISEVDSTAKSIVYDLEVHVTEHDGEIIMEWLYATDLFVAETIRRFCANFETLLNSALQAPERSVNQLTMLAQSETYQVVSGWNDTSMDYPVNENVAHLFDNIALRCPDQIALRDLNAQMSYGELNQKANRLAHYLAEQGVKPETMVGVSIERSFELVVAVIAIIKSGGVFLPLDPEYPNQRLADMVADAGCQLILSNNHCLEKISGVEAEIVMLDTLDLTEYSDGQFDLNAPGLEADHLAYVVYTSGSTGKAKGVAVTQGNWVAYFHSVQHEYRIRPQDRVLQFASASFDVFVDEMTLSLFTGASLVLRSKDMLSSAENFWGFVEQTGISVLSLTPGLWHMLIGNITEQQVDIVRQYIHLCIVGGDTMNRELLRHWQRDIGSGPTLYNVYGPTETTSISTLVDVTHLDLDNDTPTIGRPLANETCYVLDSNLQPVPIGVKGEIYIGGRGVARGYLNRQQLTDERFIPDPFATTADARMYKTGDLARWLPNAEMEFIGRDDFQVKIRGFRIELGEVEQHILSAEEVKDTVVLAHESHQGTKQLIAYVLLESDYERHGCEPIKQKLSVKMPQYMMPTRFIQLAEFPLTDNGKVDRRALPDCVEVEQSSGQTMALSPLAQRIKEMFEAVLDSKVEDCEQSFFELGGDSLSAISLISKAKNLNLTLTLPQLYQNQSVLQLSHALSAQLSDSEQLAINVLLPLSKQKADKTLYCFHPLTGVAGCYQALAQQLEGVANIYGIQSPDLVSESAHDCLMDLCRSYCQILIDHHRGKPFYLVGYSLGGVIAYEVALMLKAQGEQVASLTIIDTVPLPFEGEKEYWFSALLNVLEMIEVEFNFDWQSLDDKPKEQQVATLANLLHEQQTLPIEGLNQQMISYFVGYLLDLQKAFFSFETSSSDIDLQLMVSQDDNGKHNHHFTPMWQNKTSGEIRVFEAKGRHEIMLDSPNVESLGKYLMEYIDETG